MPRRKRVDWTVIDARTGEALCKRCHAREALPLPAPIGAFVKWIQYFNEKHAHCEG